MDNSGYSDTVADSIRYLGRILPHVAGEYGLIIGYWVSPLSSTIRAGEYGPMCLHLQVVGIELRSHGCEYTTQANLTKLFFFQLNVFNVAFQPLHSVQFLHSVVLVQGCQISKYARFSI